ncbi:MAG: MFS transporter [Actinomycetota bacterium]
MRERDFALFWTGQSISVLGDGLFTVALAIQTLRVSSSTAAFGFVLAARSVPRVLFVLIGGAVGDRLPKRLTLFATDVERGVVVALIAVGAAAHSLRLWHLIVMAVLFGTGDAFFFPISTSIIPELLPQPLLLSGNALKQSSQLFGEDLLGPATGGVLVAAIGTAWAFGADALSFALSGVCLLLMRPHPAPATERHSMLADIAEGFRYTRKHRWVWVTITVAGIANFITFAPLIALTPLFVTRHLHAGARGLGLVFASGGIGGLLAMAVSARRGRPPRIIAVMWGSWFVAELSIIGFGLSHRLWLAALFYAVAGYGLSRGNVLWNALIQSDVPREVLSRVSSLDWMVSLGLFPLGLAIAAPIAGAIGVSRTLVIAGSLAAVNVLWLLAPGVRDPDRARA